MIKRRLASIPKAETTKATRNDATGMTIKDVNATFDNKLATNPSTMLPQTQYKNVNDSRLKDSNSLSPYK